MAVRKRTWTNADGRESKRWLVDYTDGDGRTYVASAVQAFRGRTARRSAHPAHVDRARKDDAGVSEQAGRRLGGLAGRAQGSTPFTSTTK